VLRIPWCNELTDLLYPAIPPGIFLKSISAVHFAAGEVANVEFEGFR
jgi:hypothetical protein